MTEQEKHTIHLSTDVDSKIQFLETAFGGKDWRTTIAFPAGDAMGLSKAREVKQRLDKRGYITELEKDGHGGIVLSLHHVGEGTAVFELLQKEGFFKGAYHTITKPLVAVSDLANHASRASDMMSNYFNDVARANGLFFLTAELFLTAAGLGNKEGKITDPKNALQSIAGALFASQSITYMAAKTGGEMAFGDLKKQIDGKVHGKVDKDLNITPPSEEQQKKPNAVTKFIKKHPVEIGAMANNLGMLAYAGHVVLERNSKPEYIERKSGELAGKEKGLQRMQDLMHDALPEERKGIQVSLDALNKEIKELSQDISKASEYLHGGYRKELIGIGLSLVAWSLLLIPNKHYEDNEKSDNPIKRLWQNFRADPQVVAGSMTVGASSFRLAGALGKENFVQAVGEGIYIPGDVLLMFTKNSHYGKAGNIDYDALGEMVGQYLQSMPVVYGEKMLDAHVEQIADYLAEKSYAMEVDELKDKSKAGELPSVEERKKGLVRHIRLKTRAVAHDKLESLAEAAHRITQHVPAEHQAGLKETLVDTITQMDGVLATKEEVTESLDYYIKQDSEHEHAPNGGNMKQLAADVADLTMVIPGTAAGDNALKLYEALSNHISGDALSQEQLQQAMMAKMQQGLGLDHPTKQSLTADEGQWAQMAQQKRSTGQEALR